MKEEYTIHSGCLATRYMYAGQLKPEEIQIPKVGSAFQVIKLRPIVQHHNKQEEVLANLKYLKIWIHILRKVNIYMVNG